MIIGDQMQFIKHTSHDMFYQGNLCEETMRVREKSKKNVN